MIPDAATPNEAVCIEVIKAERKFLRHGATVDFDVNNLKLKRAADVRSKPRIISLYIRCSTVEPIGEKPRTMKRWAKMVYRG